MTTTQQTFVLTGALAGKTVPINGHEFVDGKMTYVGGAAQVETLARILADYGVVKEGEELRQGQQADMSDDEIADPARSVPDYTDGRKIGVSDISGSGAIDDLQTDRQDRLVEGGEVVKADPDAKPSGEAQDVVRSEDGDRLVLTEPTTSKTEPQDQPATPAEQAGAQQQGEQPKQEGTDAAPKAPSVKDESEKPTLGEAVAELDAESDADWTSNNLPSIERLSAITGTKVTRAQVDEVAEGYTRARARQAKQQ